MADAACSEAEFIDYIKKHGPTETAKILNMSVRKVFCRKKRIEKRNQITLSGPNNYKSQYPARVPIELENGTMMIASDCHFWPDMVSTAFKGFIALTKILKPNVVVLNGDVLDGAGASRHPPIGWANTPTLRQEKDAVMDRTMEILKATPKTCKHYWTLGNHCQRFENKLAQNASEFRDVEGFTLAHHFPLWEMAMSLWVNDDLVIKHRFKGGVHATHNNTAASGKSMATGHLHSLKVTPYSDYNGVRFGIDSGTLADPYGPQFAYGEDNPLNHRSGFIVLTFKDGVLLWPEICAVVDENHVQFRGVVYEV